MTMLIGSQEAAERLGISQRRIRRLCQTGQIPARKIGRDWLINPECEEFVERYERKEEEDHD